MSIGGRAVLEEANVFWIFQEEIKGINARRRALNRKREEQGEPLRAELAESFEHAGEVIERWGSRFPAAASGRRLYALARYRRAQSQPCFAQRRLPVDGLGRRLYRVLANGHHDENRRRIRLRNRTD